MQSIWKKNQLFIYGFHLCHSLIFAYVIERLFWRSRGITIGDTVLIEAIYAIVIVLLEVPSGTWADRWSRKSLIVWAQILSILEIATLILARNVWMFALAIVFAAISGALRSGSINALVYDSLKTESKETQFDKILGRIRAVEFSSHMLAALVGSYLASRFNLLVPYQFSLISGVLALFFSLMLIEPERTINEVIDTQPMMLVVKNALHKIHQVDGLKTVFISGLLVGASVNYLWEFWQNYTEAVKIDVIYFGIVSSVFSISVAIASLYAYKLKGQLKYKPALTVIGFGFIGLQAFPVKEALLFMVIIHVVSAYMETILVSDLHGQIESQYRATIESVYSLFMRAGTILVGIIFAGVNYYFGLFAAFGSIGILVLSYLGIQGILTLKH